MLHGDKQPTREKLPPWLIEARSLTELKEFVLRPDVHAAFFVPYVPSFVTFPSTYRPMVDSYRSIVNPATNAYMQEYVENAFRIFDPDFHRGGEAVRFDGPWNDAHTAPALKRHRDVDAENSGVRIIRAFGKSTEYSESEDGPGITLPENAICAHAYKTWNPLEKEYVSPWHNKPAPVEHGAVRVSIVIDFDRKKKSRD